MRNKIEAIRLDLENDSKVDKLQWFFFLKKKERLAISELEKILDLPKGTAIAVACKFMLDELKNIKEKGNEKI